MTYFHQDKKLNIIGNLFRWGDDLISSDKEISPVLLSQAACQAEFNENEVVTNEFCGDLEAGVS